MPFYDYKCDDGHVTEQRNHVDVDTIVCPECGKTAKRQISLSSFILKGTGWYETDFKHSGEKPSDT